MPHQDLPAPPDEIRSSGAEQQHITIAPADLMQPGVSSALPPQPKQRPSRRTTSRLFKVFGTIEVVLAGLLLWSLVASYANETVSSPTFGIFAVMLLAAVVGGIHFYRKGWQSGHDARNVMAVLPAAVLVVLFTMGAVESATQAPADDLTDVLAAADAYRSASNLIWIDYLDPEVSADSWVRTVDTHMPAMQRALDAVNAEVSSVQDDELRAKFQAFADVLREEVDLLTDLRNAVANHDRQAELAANRRISDLQSERLRVIQDLAGENGATLGS